MDNNSWLNGHIIRIGSLPDLNDVNPEVVKLVEECRNRQYPQKKSYLEARIFSIRTNAPKFTLGKRRRKAVI